MKTLVAAAVGAIAATCVFGAALAGPAGNPIATQGTVSGDYAYTTFSNTVGGSNSYGGNLAGVTPFGGDWSGQLSGGYHTSDFYHGSVHLDDWTVAGTVSWDKPWGRLGLNVGYDGLSGNGAHIDVTNYGVYGLFYPNAQWTLGVRGGGVTTSASSPGFGASQSGGYVGGEVLAYAMPNLEIRGDVAYATVSSVNQTNAGLRAEWLVSQTTPISVWAGYEYTSLTLGRFGTATGNGVSVGLKYYFGGMPASLADRRRSGVDDFGPATVQFVF